MNAYPTELINNNPKIMSVLGRLRTVGFTKGKFDRTKVTGNRNPRYQPDHNPTFAPLILNRTDVH